MLLRPLKHRRQTSNAKKLLRPVKHRRQTRNANVVGIQHLSNEILFMIFSLLEVRDLHKNVALVCQRFLQISRMEGMVRHCKIDITNKICLCNRTPSHINRLMKRWMTQTNLIKIENLLKFHPKCKLGLIWRDQHQHMNVFLPWQRGGLFQQEEFITLVHSVEALCVKDIRTMKTMNSMFDDIIEFPNVKHLGLSFNEYNHSVWRNMTSSQRYCIHNAPNSFWKKFPNVTGLYITCFFENRHYRVVANFSKIFPKLEELYYNGITHRIR